MDGRVVRLTVDWGLLRVGFGVGFAVLLGVGDGLAGAELEGTAAMWSLALTEGVVVGSSSLRNSPKALPQTQRLSSTAKVIPITLAG
jgi:hypothetical protein